MLQANHHILIVDDNLKNLQVTGKLLKDMGYLISLASGGQQAILQLETESPSLILLDIMMPEMDGLETCRIIKQNPKWTEIPIIFLIAKTETEDLVEGFKAGGVDYITKPFNREELLVRIRTHLELSNAKKKIVEMNKTRDKLYSIIAHDIRSPLASITQTLEIVTDGLFSPTDPNYNEFMSILYERSKNIGILLDSLLQWTRSQSEMLEIVLKLNNITPMLQNSKALLETNAKNKNIDIVIDISESTLAVCDEISMLTVF